jgi:hypothetical protein
MLFDNRSLEKPIWLVGFQVQFCFGVTFPQTTSQWTQTRLDFFVLHMTETGDNGIATCLVAPSCGGCNGMPNTICAMCATGVVSTRSDRGSRALIAHSVGWGGQLLWRIRPSWLFVVVVVVVRGEYVLWCGWWFRQGSVSASSSGFNKTAVSALSDFTSLFVLGSWDDFSLSGYIPAVVFYDN